MSLEERLADLAARMVRELDAHSYASDFGYSGYDSLPAVVAERWIEELHAILAGGFYATCPVCNGDGNVYIIPKRDWTLCPQCEGRGKVPVEP